MGEEESGWASEMGGLDHVKKETRPVRHKSDFGSGKILSNVVRWMGQRSRVTWGDPLLGWTLLNVGPLLLQESSFSYPSGA